MELEIRPITPDELPAFIRNDALAFGGQTDDGEIEEIRATFAFERSLAAFVDGRLVGTAGAYPFTMTLPGLTSTPVAGVSWVGVRPTHRRRGILRVLMERQLDDVAARGEALAILTASESGIYARFGYGLATSSMSVEIDPRYARFQQPITPTGRLEMLDHEQALAVLPEIYDRARRLQPGALTRSPERWRGILAQSAERDKRDGPRFYASYESAPGQVDGAAIYRIKGQWADDIAANVLTVREVMATTAEAYAALWDFLLYVDLVGTVRAEERPVDDPLRWLLAEPRRLRVTRLGDELWVRLLDIPAALSARRYAVTGALVFAVHDAFRPRDDGRYMLEAGRDGAVCRPTDAAADIALDVAELGAVYLGGVSFSTLARAGRIHEASAEALRRADALFAPDRAPFCGTGF